MAACEKYLELISRYTDGDLSGDEAEELFEHLSHCAGCSEALSSFEELRMMTADTLNEVPERLRSGVMASVDARKNRPWYVRYRFTAVAAVFALVILGVSATPLARYFTPQTENQALTEEIVSDQVPTSFSAGGSESGATQENTPMTARSAPTVETTDAPPAEAEQKLASTEDAESPVEEQSMSVDPADGSAGSGSAPSEEALQEDMAEESAETVDPALLPQTPYDRTFASYLVFSAAEAPEVLYSITSDQTVDHVIYYIVSPEQLATVQSALLEGGVELSVIPGDPESEEALLILTIEE